MKFPKPFAVLDRVPSGQGILEKSGNLVLVSPGPGKVRENDNFLKRSGKCQGK